MDDIVWNDLHIPEAQLPCAISEGGLPDSDLTRCIAAPSSDCRKNALDEHLRISKILFEKQDLAARLQKPVKRFQVLRETVMAQDRCTDHVIDRCLRQLVKAPDHTSTYVGSRL